MSDCAGSIRDSICRDYGDVITNVSVPITAISFAINSCSLGLLIYYQFYKGITRQIAFSYTTFSWIFTLMRVLFIAITNAGSETWSSLIAIKIIEFSMSGLLISAAMAMISFFILFDYRMSRLENWTDEDNRIVRIIYSVCGIFSVGCMIGTVSIGDHFYVSNGFAWIETETEPNQTIFYALFFAGFAIPCAGVIVAYVAYRAFLRPKLDLNNEVSASARLQYLYDVLDSYMTIFTIFNTPTILMIALSLNQKLVEDHGFNAVKFVFAITFNALESVAVACVLVFHFRSKVATTIRQIAMDLRAIQNDCGGEHMRDIEMDNIRSAKKAVEQQM